MTRPLIKIYGERNTCTNYLSRLINLNLDVEEIPGIPPRFVSRLQSIVPGRELVSDIYYALTYKYNLGWKHTCVKPALLKDLHISTNNLSFVTITKNPYSWLLSLYKRPYHQYYRNKPDFETFLKTPWKTVGRENVPNMLSNPIELWNIKNSSYLQLKNEFPALNITAEDILCNPADTIDLLSKTFSYKRKSTQFQSFEESISGKEKDKNPNYYRSYYLNEKWKENLSPKAISIINENLDRKIMEYFGYEKLA